MTIGKYLRTLELEAELTASNVEWLLEQAWTTPKDVRHDLEAAIQDMQRAKGVLLGVSQFCALLEASGVIHLGTSMDIEEVEIAGWAA